MGISIDIVSGFFQSGKTTFINRYIEHEVAEVFDKVLIINCEVGVEKYRNFKNCEVIVERIEKQEDFNREKINSIIEKVSPEYVIIEYNGVWDISQVAGIAYPKGCNIRNLFMIADFRTFDSYLANMESIMLDKISNCDVFVFTKSGYENIRPKNSLIESREEKNVNGKDRNIFDDIEEDDIDEEYFESRVKTEEYKAFEKELDIKCEAISHINSACSIYLEEDLFTGDKFDFIDTKITRSDFEIVKLGFFIGIFYTVLLGIKALFPDFYSAKVEHGIWIFLSLLIQIVPFILLGALISGIIQVFVPKNRFFRMFEKTSVKSLFLALFMGAFFPVCDCAMVPIATSIAKKGYSIPVTITFLLASPAVNPIVILSTYYAFPNMPKMVVYRIVYGIAIAFVMGLILYGIEKFKTVKSLKKASADISGNNLGAEEAEYRRETAVREAKENYRRGVIKDHIDKYRFTELDTNKLKTKGKMRYAEAIIIHCKQELFKIGPYIIFGAMISSFIQVCVPRGVFATMNQVNFLAVAMMLICAFFISICSTSNAFIARSFYNIMPINAILAFVVMGPILDITNISVMLGTFKKKFIIGLIAGLVYIAFVVFSIMGGGVGIV